ncbi:hypothetical protein H5410_032898 [Solanum commersonii]|uniref:Uncharacterized protein n=1 Tax=Solanum commersonii TaxID=4109 RepID=A0A9J5YP78_SOLCO|nr:hypothetical protein H5410_032898 [Solanum commersonii]
MNSAEKYGSRACLQSNASSDSSQDIFPENFEPHLTTLNSETLVPQTRFYPTHHHHLRLPTAVSPRHIPFCSPDNSLFLVHALFQGHGEPKISNLGSLVPTYKENISRFDVTVNDSFIVYTTEP